MDGLKAVPFKSIGFFRSRLSLYSTALALPALKRVIEARLFLGALKRSFPRINAGAKSPDFVGHLWPD
jgi:hypothetical protein